VLWVGVGLGIVIVFAVPVPLKRYAARRGDRGYRPRSMASTGGLLLGGGLAMQFTIPLSGLGVLAVGAALCTVFLLWFRRRRVGPPIC
jgi:hypothetical protein